MTSINSFVQVTTNGVVIVLNNWKNDVVFKIKTSLSLNNVAKGPGGRAGNVVVL